MELIHHEGEDIALILKHEYAPQEKISFLTQKDSILQLGYLKHQKGSVIKAHIHNPIERKIVGTQEVLWVKKGTIQVDLYDSKKTLVSKKQLSSGDLILLLSGGHGISILDDAEIVEVKNGPYVLDKDKTHF
jgi:hypothetical protein